MKGESARKGAPEAATAKRQARRHLTVVIDTPQQLPLPVAAFSEQLEDDNRRSEGTFGRSGPRPGPQSGANGGPGFFEKALSGKVRPAPRWSA